jgi:hypothetical protein
MDTKFADQIRLFRDQTKREAPAETAATLPLLAIDLDSMARTVPYDGTATFTKQKL